MADQDVRRALWRTAEILTAMQNHSGGAASHVSQRRYDEWRKSGLASHGDYADPDEAIS